MATHLVWFRLDLRITDNKALAAACRDPDARVIGVFIGTPQQWQRQDMAPRQACWIWLHLLALHRQLADLNIPLHCLSVSDYSQSIDALVGFCQHKSVDRLFYNYQYEINERHRDAGVEQRLEGQVISQGFDDGLLLTPGSVRTGGGEMYKVFTPFSRVCFQRLRDDLPACIEAPEPRASWPEEMPDAPGPFDLDMDDVDGVRFPAGEAAAQARLACFCRERVDDYEADRDFPALDGTSGISPWLTVGAISPRQCLQALLTARPEALEEGPGQKWLTEILWREFYRHLLVAWPKLCRYRPFIDWTDKVAWQGDKALLTAWQQGQTGYPIIDAAMRQLNHTGWMHNRLRMLTASFLVKDLLIDWRAGERYFMSRLLDGDLAANNGGWQWCASTGTDSAPYFRIFNPTTQGERFDPDGAFIRQWVPELARIPGKGIHQPWRWAEQHGVTLDYPRPIVDHKQARAATLDAYQTARQYK